MIDRSTNIQAALRSRQRGFLLNPFRFGGGGGGGTDPSWSNVSLLLQAGTAITDVSQRTKAVTISGIGGGIVPSSTVTQFGEKTIYQPGSPQGWILLPNHADFDFGSGDFTIEAFVQPGSTGEMGIFSKRGSGSNYSPIIVAIRSNRLYMLGSFGGTSWNINGGFANGVTSVPAGVLTHVAVCRSGSTIRGFVAGAVDQSYSVATNALMTNTTQVSIGASAENGANTFIGYSYGIRVTKGVARYTAAFTPPSAPFPTS